VKACVQTAVGRVELVEIPDPEPGEGEVVVRVRAALTCGTDAKLFRRGHPRIPLPTVAGHEFAGEIAEVGRGVSGFHPGDRVSAGLTAPCGRCPQCRAGFSNLCGPAAASRVWGAFAEMIKIPAGVVAQNLYRIPDRIDLAEAAILDPLASVVHGFARLEPAPGGTLVVLGLGALGLLWVGVARSLGVDRVIGLGKGSRRLAVARDFGAVTVDVETEDPMERLRDLCPEGVEAVVECVGEPRAWEEAVEYAAPGGRVVFFGGCAAGSRASFDTTAIHYGELTLVGSFHYRPQDAARAAEMLSAGTVAVSPLLTDRARLEDVPGLLGDWGRANRIKTVIEM
jgi:L-iditol 2-dehydrogenase